LGININKNIALNLFVFIFICCPNVRHKRPSECEVRRPKGAHLMALLADF